MPAPVRHGGGVAGARVQDAGNVGVPWQWSQAWRHHRYE
jgi:hypothetical protein